MTQPPDDRDYEPVDLDSLAERQAPLAELIRTLQLSNTWRDNKDAIAEDLSIALKARDGESELARAFDAYENSRQERGAPDATSMSRRDLAAQIREEIDPE